MVEKAILEVQGLCKLYGEKTVLDHFDLSIRPGEVVAVLGASGAGKTSLFKLISGLVPPDSGRIGFLGRNLLGLRGNERRLARREIGFIFQQFNLVRRMSALGNVLGGRLGYAPTWRVFLRRFTLEDQDLAKMCLASVGLAPYIWQRADSLSGGQQQRVAIARALAQQCRFILADEPVASLDPESSRSVLQSLRQVARERQVGVLCSLHQVDLASQYADRIIGLAHGRIVCDIPAGEIDEEIISRIYGSSITRAKPVDANRPASDSVCLPLTETLV